MLNVSPRRAAWFGALTALIALAACSSSPTNPNSQSGASTVATDATANAAPTAAAQSDAPAKKTDVATAAPTSTGASQMQHAGNGAPVMSLIEVARPPFAYTLKQAVKVEAGDPPKITKTSEKKNAITDDIAWFEKNGLTLTGRMPRTGPPTLPTAPDSVPATLGSNKLHFILEHGDHTVLLYGPNWASMHEFIILDKSGRPHFQYDFSTFVKPLEVVPGDEDFTNAQVAWAIEKDGVLYVSTAHPTYAKSSKGKNAFVTAIDAKTGELFWQSDPLVCNAQNFVIHGGYIICGYGFTAEPDFLYVLSRANGKTVSKTPLKSGPTYLVMKDGKLYVRTYDTDYVFDIK
ncbi:MAG: hypothetical protein IPM54_27215 [Polyangiaceae bacterium]|nr:hypothetical protein [Polyangiaceae bacterium]